MTEVRRCSRCGQLSIIDITL